MLLHLAKHMNSKRLIAESMCVQRAMRGSKGPATMWAEVPGEYGEGFGSFFDIRNVLLNKNILRVLQVCRCEGLKSQIVALSSGSRVMFCILLSKCIQPA